MSLISLRKRDPEPDLDEEPEETAEEPDDEEQPPNKPKKEVGFFGALLIGIRGPAQWIAGRFGTGVAWGAHAIALWAFGYYGGWIALGIALAWLLAILLFIPREHLERAATAIEQLGERRHQPRDKNAPEAGEEPAPDPLVTVLWRLIADAPGVHLKTLAEHLQAAAPDQPIDRAQVRAKIAALRIPIRASVRDAAGRVNEGVHRTDLKAWEQALPRAAPGTPSRTPTGPVATPVTCDVGDATTDIATPLSRVRRLLSRGGT